MHIFKSIFFIPEPRNFPSGKVYYTVLERKCKRLWLVDFVNLAPEKFDTFIWNNEQQILGYNLFKFCKWMNDSDSVDTRKEDKAILDLHQLVYCALSTASHHWALLHMVFTFRCSPALNHFLQILLYLNFIFM